MARNFLVALATLLGFGCGEPDVVAQQWVEEGATLLDVRTTSEFGAGHIRGAINIPVQDLPARIDELDGGRRVVVYCRSGNRSATARALLQDRGFEVHDLGTMGRWGRDGDIVR